ncbi:MAG: transcription termination/antitermination protein NusG, partial [Oscillospiraceae bacterium]|nr:transcription termination/antitermination protein NusG [Oscillospiraceae bacterium]
DESWHLVRNVRGVTGFIGTQTTAVPLTPAEIEKMGLDSDTPVKVDAKADFAVDEAVVVLDGPLSGQNGVIVQVDAARQSAIVIVSMFGRETPVELSFSQIKREA